ncbi:MAG: protein kinase [Microcoleaceae cyanobacterium]
MVDLLTLTRLDPKTQTPLQQWEFPAKSAVNIGRASDNMVVIVDPLVSRYHVELQPLEPGGLSVGWRLINRGTNGTYVNGILTSQTLVTSGMVLELARGGPLLQLQLKSVAIATPSPSGCTHGGNPPENLFCIHCGYPIQVERTIREYLVLRTIGRGGMGSTAVAWHPPTVQMMSHNSQPIPPMVVIKEMNADMSRIAKARELFEREARILKGLNHPGIPQFYDFFIEDGKKYLVMEMIHGQDLEKRVQQYGPVLPQQGIDWMRQTCKILDYIHRQQPPLIHRDVKPANLLLRQRDHSIILIDFGAVKEIGTPPGTRIGAEGYSAPEQDRGQPLTQSDIYAIGTTLIFLLTGESPLKFYGKQQMGYGFNLDAVPTIPPKLRDVIDCATAFRVRDRYSTAQAVADALENALE